MLSCFSYTIYNYVTGIYNSDFFAGKITNSTVLGLSVVVYRCFFVKKKRTSTATLASEGDLEDQDNIILEAMDVDYSSKQKSP